MTNNEQSSSRIQKRPWAALWSVLVLAPLAMAPKGCDSAVVGDNNCAKDVSYYPRPACGNGNAAGSDSMASAGTAGRASTGTGGGSPGTPSAGSAGAPDDETCGGIANRTCASGEYCLFDVKTAACGSGDQTGVCTPRPQVCLDIYLPVCGCDSKTYGNDCEAATNGFSVLHTGACEDPSSGATCGGLLGTACAKSEYCNFPVATACGSSDQTGTCTRIPQVCDTISDPVCGCDNVTYSSECVAASKGTSVLHKGACEPATGGATCGGLIGAACPKGQACIFPVEAKCGAADMTGTCQNTGGFCPQNIDVQCGCDGKTYSNTCAANSQGISVANAGECKTTGTTCGGKLGVTCADSEYCDYPPSANCGKADATGTCTAKLTGACTQIYDPVCGCDGKTYGNACAAGSAGMSVASKGACP
ncbi:MAG TPA: Kazal-type serine protease inhibitor domain-containing protein [Polyangiaceae bacterium]|nr:Kazal-type serine protease inhibitor domain-containing protein [Polyangiaceae bacterium]